MRRQFHSQVVRQLMEQLQLLYKIHMQEFGLILWRREGFMLRVAHPLKAVVIAFSLALVSSSSYAQCSGQPTSGLVCGNPSASTTFPIWATQSALLDRGFSTTQGTILNRGVSLWAATSSPSLGINGGVGGS